jgi:hypothetical protein
MRLWSTLVSHHATDRATTLDGDEPEDGQNDDDDHRSAEQRQWLLNGIAAQVSPSMSTSALCGGVRQCR